jgi:hypothetical protein
MTSRHQTVLAPCRRWLHTQVLGLGLGLCLVSLGALALLAPASAAAQARPRSLNASADQAAMTAYRTYLSGLTAGALGAAARASQVEIHVSSTCPDALTDLAQLSADQVKASALTAFGNEVDAELQLAYISGNATALNRLGGALDALSWSTVTPAATTTAFIRAERALAAVTSSNLCKDAAALDAAPLSEPMSTRRFLARYHAATRALNLSRAAFQSLLAKFQSPTETRLVAQINGLAAQYVSQASAVEQTDADAVLAALGLSSSTS